MSPNSGTPNCAAGAGSSFSHTQPQPHTPSCLTCDCTPQKHQQETPPDPAGGWICPSLLLPTLEFLHMHV